MAILGRRQLEALIVLGDGQPRTLAQVAHEAGWRADADYCNLRDWRCIHALIDQGLATFVDWDRNVLVITDAGEFALTLGGAA